MSAKTKKLTFVFFSKNFKLQPNRVNLVKFFGPWFFSTKRRRGSLSNQTFPSMPGALPKLRLAEMEIRRSPVEGNGSWNPSIHKVSKTSKPWLGMGFLTHQLYKIWVLWWKNTATKMSNLPLHLYSVFIPFPSFSRFCPSFNQSRERMEIWSPYFLMYAALNIHTVLRWHHPISDFDEIWWSLICLEKCRTNFLPNLWAKKWWNMP